ncbi:MAG: anti-sigma factor family protein [Bryobacteraceae bacterium]
MNADCQRALLNLDREQDAVETAWQNAHLAGCEACRAETELRERVQVGLRRAVRTQTVEPELEQRVRASLARPGFRRQWQPYAAAAALLIAVSGYWALPWVENRMAESAYFRSLPESVSQIMRVGLSDHVHCAVFRKWPKQAPPVAEVVMDLPAPYRPVTAHIPAGYRVVAGHECRAQGRSFIHLIMRGPEDKTVSLVMAKKQAGETFANSSLRRVMGALPVFSEDVPRFQIAGFEAASFLIFVVSDLDGAENRQLALTLAGPVTAMLDKLG